MNAPRILLALLLATVMGCASRPVPPPPNPYLGPPPPADAAENVAFHGGDGSNCEQAIIIKGAANTLLGLGAENQWIEEHHPGAQRLSTHQGDCPDRITDVVEIRTTAGEQEFIYFDISEFYGKW